MLYKLFNDEAGFIVSAELVLISTLLVIGMIVGLSSVQHAVVAELNDVGNAIGSLNQSYSFSGFSARVGGGGGQGGGQGGGGGGGGTKAMTRGSAFHDSVDVLDGQVSIACDSPVAEGSN